MGLIKGTLGVLLLLFVAGAPVVVRAQTEADESNATKASNEAQRQLASKDPLVRQRAAEELARAADPGLRKLLEGYRLQEKNVRARLALDWALYRIGKTEGLFAIVRALDSPRAEQAGSYLAALDSPEPLYIFLERANGITQVKLLEVLAKNGDAGTLDKIKPYLQSFDPKVASAAQGAASEIEGRLGQTPVDSATRPRQVGQGESTP